MTVPGFIKRMAAGDEILAEYLNGLARAANLSFSDGEGYIDADARALNTSQLSPILHAQTTTLVPPFSVFGVAASVNTGSVPEVEIRQFGSNVGPWGLFTNGAVEIPANHAGVIYAIPSDFPTRVKCTSSVTQGDPVGPVWNDWTVDRFLGYNMLCIDGPDAAIADTCQVISISEPRALVVEVTGTVSGLSGTTMGTGTGVVRVAGGANTLVASGFTTGVTLYNISAASIGIGEYVLCHPVSGIGLVVDTHCQESIIDLRINSLAIEYKKRNSDCTESPWTELAPGVNCP